MVNLARFLKLDPEESLAKSCEKFMARFAKAEELAAGEGLQFSNCSIHQLNQSWDQSKKELAGEPAKL